MAGIRFKLGSPADYEKLIKKSLGESQSKNEKLEQLKNRKGYRPQKKAANPKKINYDTLPVLDLHGCKREEAIFRLENFIRKQAINGEKALLVVTGKGMNSGEEGPVIKNAVWNWLKDDNKRLVASFHHPPAKLGGTGAVIIHVKKA